MSARTWKRVLDEIERMVDGFISDRNGSVNSATQWDEQMQKFYLERFTAVRGAIPGRRLSEQYVGQRAACG